MGWSSSVLAGDVMDMWTKACIASTNSQNVWQDKNGNRYFWESSRKEYDDGSITGSIWKEILGGYKCIRAGSFRINGDGTIERAPRFLKDCTVQFIST